MDIQEAYQQFGVTEDATDEAIEQQYEKWIKRHQASQLDQNRDSQVDMDVINKAYQTIKHNRQFGDETKPNSSPFKEKLEHFFTYYKLHTIGIIVLIAIVIGIVQTLVDNQQQKQELASLPPASVKVMFFGSFVTADLTKLDQTEKQLAENILDKFPNWQRVETILNYSPVGVNSETDIGMKQKSAAVIATEKPDMYIMDLEYFKTYVTSGMFYALDDLSNSIKDDQLYATKAELDDAEHIYGVEITDASVFNKIPYREETKKIAAIRKDAANKENAMELILKLSSTAK
ncbi:J domain-containing protein [Aquibacillus salsiterrae]|uniref:J domain-containing protein n=1 Tax=Aquibacillus salsiterrae TaxID=2950439 RepID=A0A9X3WER9_9BACI|nr:hypothetical protein [Aquibacillus salsiterrae]MDC3416910.1 hypothetical protein [Aquibacillus salsiterrae]